MAGMLGRMATLLDNARPGTCMHRLLRSQPGIRAAILVGCSDLLQRAARELLPLPPEQQQTSVGAELQQQAPPDWLAQLLNAAASLFAHVLAHSWPAGTCGDATTLHGHLSSFVSRLGRLLLPGHQEQVEQLVQAFESASRPSRVHGSRLIAATAEALAALAWHVARSSAPASEAAGAAVNWCVELHVGLVRVLVDSAACLAASCGEQPTIDDLQLVASCFGTAATLWGSCLNHAWPDSSRLGSGETGSVLLLTARNYPCCRLYQLQQLPVPCQAAVVQAVAAPAAQFLEATIRAVGRHCQAADSTQVDTQVCTPQLSGCTLSLKDLVSLGAACSSLPTTSAGRTGWRTLLHLLRSAAKLCCQVAGDARQLPRGNSSPVPDVQLRTAVDVARYAVEVLQNAAGAVLQAWRRRAPHGDAEQKQKDRCGLLLPCPAGFQHELPLSMRHLAASKSCPATDTPPLPCSAPLQHAVAQCDALRPCCVPAPGQRCYSTHAVS